MTTEVKPIPDCYFFVDVAVPEHLRTMSVLCVECHDTKLPDTGWFYRGSTEGYGPFCYKCHQCGNIIYQPEQDDSTNEQTEEN